MQNHGNCSAEASGASRRQFLTTGATTIATLALPELLRRPAAAAVRSLTGAGSLPNGAQGNKSVLFVTLPGGPSQLDMYDMKPDAPANIRGEFRPINTNVSGMRVCEHLPLHAKMAEKFAVIHGVETVDKHDQEIIDGAAAGARVESITLSNPGGTDSRLETKSRKNISLPLGDWDTHGQVLGRQTSIFQELREKLPAYDRLLHDLITDIYDRGLDKDVLIIACGEFGRAPWINEHGGRNHWATSGSVLFAGGGLKMGQTIGDTGPIGERERSRSQPYTLANIYATMFRHLGVDQTILSPGAQPIAELI